MAMKIIANLPMLIDGFGEAHDFPEYQHCPNGCPHASEVKCRTHRHVIYSVAQWLKLFLRNLPAGQLSMVDQERIFDISKALRPAVEGKEEVIKLETADLDWLNKILFNEEEGRRVSPKNARGEPILNGAYAANAFAPSPSIPLRKALQTATDEPSKPTIVNNEPQSVEARS